MKKFSTRILKSDDFVLEGTFLLGLTPGRLGSIAGGPKTLVQPKVRIIESKPDFVLLEVTCSCGTPTTIKCEYAGNETQINTKQETGE